MRRALFLSLALAGCGALQLGYNALTYRTSASGEANNLALHGGRAYASLGPKGFEIVDLSSGRAMALHPTPPGLGSVDDVAIADGLLFVLDARAPGHLAVLSLRDPMNPAPVGEPTPVPVEPFTGVSAAAGLVAVSGGTSALTIRRYGLDGVLGAEVSQADAGRGQPDVRLSPDGQRLMVSTHFEGTHFGLTTFAVSAPPAPPASPGSLEIDGAGFTSGGAHPANFPIQAASLGDVAYVAHAKGVAVVDVSGPPRLLRVVDLGLQATAVDAADGLVAVVGCAPSPALVFLDATTPAAPTLQARVPLPKEGWPTAVAIDGPKVAVAAHAAGVLVFDRP